jgi:hypothetical protein
LLSQYSLPSQRKHTQKSIFLALERNGILKEKVSYSTYAGLTEEVTAFGTKLQKASSNVFQLSEDTRTTTSLWNERLLTLTVPIMTSSVSLTITFSSDTYSKKVQNQLCIVDLIRKSKKLNFILQTQLYKDSSLNCFYLFRFQSLSKVHIIGRRLRKHNLPGFSLSFRFRRKPLRDLR